MVSNNYFYLFLCILLFSSSIVSGKKKPKVKINIESKPSDCREVAEIGDTVVVHYTGALQSGQIFDTSRREGREPFEVTLGQGKVIPGWEQGLQGMCGGEVRKLTIPPELGYGDRGIEGIIPPKATLVFDVELLELKKKSSLPINGLLPQGTGFYVILGLVVICVLVVYELYKRSSQQSKDAKKQKRKGRKH